MSEPLLDRLIVLALRPVALAMALCGAAAAVATAATWAFIGDADVPATIPIAVGGTAMALLGGGGVATVLTASSASFLTGERQAARAQPRAAVGGWLLLLAVTAIAIPVLLTVALASLLVGWIEVIELGASSRIWQGANANMSGVVVLPLATAMAVPAIELATWLLFVSAPLLLLPLLFSRSWRFPRLFMAIVVMLGALTLASVLGAWATSRGGERIEQLVRDTSTTAEEAAQLNSILRRYTSAITSAAPPLAVGLVGYLLFVPAVLSSKRTALTFARTAPAADDLEAITRPPRING